MASVNKVILIGGLGSAPVEPLWSSAYQSALLTALGKIGEIRNRGNGVIAISNRGQDACIASSAKDIFAYVGIASLSLIASKAHHVLNGHRKPLMQSAAGFFTPMKVNGRNAP